MTESLDELVSHAHETRVVVIGGGIAGLVAALECAKVGMRVTVVEASDRLGGVIRSTELDGLTLDAGAQGYATRGGAVRRLVDELGLVERTRPAAPRSLWLSGLPSGPTPFPDGTVLGIPENPWDERVRRIIGWRGTWRAYLDRLRPPLTIGQERSLGRLVRTRMGERVLDRLVAPLSVGAFAVHPDDVDVELAAPGLSSALTRTGSLAGAVAQVRATRSDKPATALEGIEGGLSLLVDALRARLDELGAEIRLSAPAESLHALAGGRWEVRAADDAAPSAADAVVIAVPEVAARSLLAPVVPALDSPVFPTAELDVVTLVVESAALTGAPRRTEVFPLPGTARSTAIADLTAQWPWLRGIVGTQRHVLRITFGRTGSAPATAALDDAAAAAMAVAEASALLSVPVDGLRVRGFDRASYAQPRPVSALGRDADATAIRQAVHAVPGLAVVGAWVAGTGLAQVVPDSVDEAERIRRTVLFGPAR